MQAAGTTGRGSRGHIREFMVAEERNYRNVLFISLSQFGMVFAFNFVLVFLPFYIHKISPYSSRDTLLWIGLIMGGPSFAAAIVSPFWGSLTSRFSPKTLFIRGLISHAVLIFLMGYVSNLPLLFMLRIVQGVMGGISTVGLIIVSASSSREWASRDIGFFQNAMTFGQLIGPPAGAMAASFLGYRGAFMTASGLVFIPLVFCFLFVVEGRAGSEDKKAERGRALNRRTLIGWVLCFTATVQLMFLPSVLPNVFEGFHIGHAAALKWAGLVVMFYTGTAMIGNHFFCRLAARVRIDRLILFVGFSGAVLQCLLSVSPGIVGFVALRMLQTAMIAAVMPLVFSIFSQDLDGKVIGLLNSGRFGGNAIGPMIATSVLAAAGLGWLYISIGILSFAAILAFAAFFDNAGQEGKLKGF